MNTPPDWDFFEPYRTYGGWDKITPFVLVGTTEEGERVHVQSQHPGVEVGDTVDCVLLGNVYTHEVDDTPFFTVAVTVTHVFSRDEFKHFNFTRATPEMVEALGHFMCGAPVHGQWISQLLLQMHTLARALDQHTHSLTKHSRGRR